MLNPFKNGPPRKIGLTLRNDVIPKVVANPFVQLTVPDDGEPPRLRRDQNQRGIAALVLVQAQPPELPYCTRERLDGCIRNNANRDATGRAAFGIGNGASYNGPLSTRHGLKFTTGGFSAPGCD